MLPVLKRRLYEILNIENTQDTATRVLNVFLIILLVVNLIAFMLQTFKEVSITYEWLFSYLEAFSVVVFTIEYLLRLWVCTEDPIYGEPIKGRIRYMTTNILAVTDLMAILPYYLPIVLPFDFLVIRTLRLFRLARLAKLARYSDSLDLIERVIVKQREFLLITLVIQFVLLLVSAAIMFYLEHEAQPAQFANIFSALLWGVSAMTSAGFAGLYPITPAGKVAGVILSFLEIVAMALPIGVITAGIEQEMSITREEAERRKRAMVRKTYLQSLRKTGPGKRG
ncbi:ion transporter [Methanocella arvoryzae]|uniref:Predicted voltage-dependent K(+) channel n=1 Tax=Methanocella arvoryzae (strain DSM 22066 / NBRC 105507 / MRE50) TaxID=351160 RepID=Q0W1H5_METAR|nr:ion transporter [Methanocella arvoryzae]CAJ37768.1 predicted voltage-dependent K(+) channel [Methanocella arvoryzae MRE50]